MSLFLGMMAGYAVAFWLMKLGANASFSAFMFWPTLVVVSIWSAFFSPWAKAREKQLREAEYKRWQEEQEKKMRREQEHQEREQRERERRQREWERREKERLKEEQERAERVRAAAKAEKERQRRMEAARVREENFLRNLFSMLAKLAKADGRVEVSEVKVAEKVFERFGFAARRRAFCAAAFNEAKDSPYTIYWYADRFEPWLTDEAFGIYVYELLWDLACADGWLHPAEKEILRLICAKLHIPESYYQINYRRRSGTFKEGDKQKDNDSRQSGTRTNAKTRRERRSAYVSGRSSIRDAYELLECEQTATKDELKSSYRRLAKRYHPDMLRNNGVPEEMITAATETMAQINAAWEDIRRERGICK